MANYKGETRKEIEAKPTETKYKNKATYIIIM
jgi:hypothetical protein